MKQEMLITIEPDGTARVKVLNEDTGHSVQLIPFEQALSGGDVGSVETYKHDHEHNNHVHAGRK
jgi:hypothetical protein